MWPVSQLAHRAFFLRPSSRRGSLPPRKEYSKFNKGCQPESGRNTGKGALAQHADGVCIAIDHDIYLEAFGVEPAVDIEELQQEAIFTAFQDSITTILLGFNEAAGIHLVIAAIKDPGCFRKRFADLLLDMQVVIEPGTLDEGLIFIGNAGGEKSHQRQHPQ